MGSIYQSLCASELSEVDKAVVVIHLIGAVDGTSTKEIASTLEAGGHAAINVSRLTKRLKLDKRVVNSAAGFKISAKYRSEVTAASSPFSGPLRPANVGNSLDSGLFENARGYVTNVVEQINISYDNACFDCAAVMIRRLFETLIVDTFEKQNCLSEITTNDGNLLQLKGLIGKLRATPSFLISRQTKEAADHLKDIGDWSAHNRRHRARKSDIDLALKHMRLAASDLLHLSGQD